MANTGWTKFISIDEPLAGITVWHVNFKTGKVEQGTVINTVYYQDMLERFSVEFENDFGWFFSGSFGKVIFLNEDDAKAAILRGGTIKI